MGQFAYASSKAASTHLSRMLALAFKDVKVRVNVIAPGVFPSEMTTGSSHDDNKSSMDMDSTNPAGRKGMDSDMAATVLFLAGKGGLFYNEQIREYTCNDLAFITANFVFYSISRWRRDIDRSVSQVAESLPEALLNRKKFKHMDSTTITAPDPLSKW